VPRIIISTVSSSSSLAATPERTPIAALDEAFVPSAVVKGVAVVDKPRRVAEIADFSNNAGAGGTAERNAD
jgi:hypothetical protein